MVSKIYISNITLDEIMKDEDDERIEKAGIHILRCDRGAEKDVISILSPQEYESVMKYGYYEVPDYD